ncbi:MAG: rRNA maturation RNase YbeY [Chthoniobacterales bacterium]
MSSGPAFVWINRQRAVRPRQLRLETARTAIERAWPEVVKAECRGSVLLRLPEISFVLVSDARIAALHDEFMRDPNPTDVITFHYGEIVLSAETARREARKRGLPLPEELARYAVHGLLHLAGWSDAAPGAASEMRAVQEKILRRALRGLC